MRLILMGSSGRQSLVTLQTLLDLGVMPLALALAAPQQVPATPSLGDIELVQARPQSALTALAQQHGIPLIEIPADGNQSDLCALAADLILVSCYPYRLPAALLDLPIHGCFNIHPSMLPDYRGPSPIFWQLRDGLPVLGVSVHKMTQRLDRGPLLCRTQLPPQPIQSYSSWVERLSVAGVQAFVGMLGPLRQGPLQLTPQPSGGSYQSWPQAADFEVERRWPASRIASFIAGTAELGRHFLRLGEGRLFVIEKLLAYSRGAHAAQSLSLAADRLVLNCRDGRLELTGACIDETAGRQGENR